MSLIDRFRHWRLGRRIQRLADRIDEMQALVRFAEEEEGRIEAELIDLWAEYAEREQAMRDERLRRLAIRRCADCLARIDLPVTDEQRRAAAEHLGRTDLLPEPQQEIELDAPQKNAA